MNKPETFAEWAHLMRFRVRPIRNGFMVLSVDSHRGYPLIRLDRWVPECGKMATFERVLPDMEHARYWRPMLATVLRDMRADILNFIRSQTP